ncbi:MAG: nucleotidyltransferase family protein [Alphaproteobacteria bacterium]
MSAHGDTPSAAEADPEIGATPALPPAFVTGLVEPLFADAGRARSAVALIGAPMALVCAERCRDPALDLKELRAAAQVEAVSAKPVRARLLAFCAAVDKAGVPTVAIKGLATSITLYPRPYQRLLPDVDLLFREDDLAAVTHLLGSWRFVTLTGAVESRRWGALTEASFAPVAPPDRAFLVDIHCHVDDAPASRGLTTEAVFARAGVVETGIGRVRVPAPEHAFCILALHAFRDFYEPRGLKSLFDAALLLRRHGAEMDWDEVERCARGGRFVKRVVFYRELLARLGAAELDAPFAGRRPSLIERRLLAAVADNFRRLDTFTMSDRRKLVLEAALLDSPIESLRWNVERLRGLIAPRTHALAGLPEA